MPTISDLRREYHLNVCHKAIFLKRGTIPSIADVGSPLSIRLSEGILERIGSSVSAEAVKGQTAGRHFEEYTKEYLQKAFSLLQHLRPGQWQFSLQGNISAFEQYYHLAELSALVKTNRELRTALGDYVVKPDILVARLPLSDAEINAEQTIVESEGQPYLTPLRGDNSDNPMPILHASISCKLTLRSDRSQNARTEGLNLIRNRKGNTPHIAVVTAEPMPTRIASLALGTGDIDCVYHFALQELIDTAQNLNNEALTDSLAIMVEGKRLRDIADLPFDLAA